MDIVYFDEVASTNTYLAEHAAQFSMPTMIVARNQTSGRGQRGNKWESEPGKNITFSAIWKPEKFPARNQFFISEATALAIVDVLASRSIEAQVKWPNDIYVDNRKICGILIEHSLIGSNIRHSIIGAGLNVNQTIFRSDAPNPVSMWQLSGQTYDIDDLLVDIADALDYALEALTSDGNSDKLHARFMRSLWRGNGAKCRYRDVATGESFHAVIAGIEPMGHLLLDDGDRIRRYAFKEVEFCDIIP